MIFPKNVHFSKNDFILANGADLIKSRLIRHYIGVFMVCLGLVSEKDPDVFLHIMARSMSLNAISN